MDTLQSEEIGMRYFEIARQYLEFDPNPDSFQHYIQLSGEEAKIYDDNNLFFNYYYYRGISAYRASRYEEAILYMDSAEYVSTYSSDTFQVGKMLYSRGVLHMQMGNDDLFQQSMMKAIEWGEKIGNVNLQNASLIALSQRAKELKLYDQQYEFLSRAYQQMDKASDRSRLKLLTQLTSYHSHHYARHGNSEDKVLAEGFVNQGIQLADSLGRQGLLTDLWIKLLHLKDIDDEIDREYLRYAEKIYASGKKMDDPFYIYKGNLLKSFAYNALGSPGKTLTLKDSLLEYAELLGRPIYFQESFNVLKNAARMTGDYDQALDFYEEYIIYTDSLNKLETAESFADAVQKYEAEKKEKEILKLQQKQREIEFEAQQKESRFNQNMLLFGLILTCLLFGVIWNHLRQKNRMTRLKFQASQNEQKLLRSQMNPHFLFNSLNSIKRFYVDGRVEEANDFMADFGNLLRQILEQSSKPYISIEEELEFLELYLDLEKRRFKKPLHYTILFNKEDFDFEDQIPSLILQPLVENSIWHGIMKSDRDGEITITVQKNGNEIKCSVMDNGIGYYSTGRSKTHTYTSRGLQLIKERMGENGIFEIKPIENSEGMVTGTLATLIFDSNVELT